MYNYITLLVDQCKFVKVCPISELPEGERIFIEIDNKPIVILNLAGKFFAIADVCSHDRGPVGDGEIVKGTRSFVPVMELSSISILVKQSGYRL